MSDIEKFDCCVVGAGVVGLAIAYKLSSKGKSVIVLEQSDTIGSGISSRNSEVIHAGIYYPANSLKAKLCVAGKQSLYEFCDTFNVPHKRLGKMIVATNPAQADQLGDIESKALTNGVNDLLWLDKAKAVAMEPNVDAYAALWSPSTGIIDVHTYMSALDAGIQQHSGLVCLNTTFLEAEKLSSGYSVTVESVGETYSFETELLVNAAGLGAQSVSSKVDGVIQSTIPELHYCRGCYFSYTGKSPFNSLIYPTPEKNTTGLGVHATLDMGGQVKFGPDTEYIPEEDYTLDESRKESFFNAIKGYFPLVDIERLIPAYTGIRPKLQGPGEAPRDFEIELSAEGYIALYGIESPGLTSSLAIADHVFTNYV